MNAEELLHLPRPETMTVRTRIISGSKDSLARSQFPGIKQNDACGQLDFVHVDTYLKRSKKETTEFCKWCELQVCQSSKIRYGKNLLLLEVLSSLRK